MDKLLNRRGFFFGNSTEKDDAGFGTHPYREIYCEGQDVNSQNTKEEQDVATMREKRKNRFVANYNMFF